MASVRIVRFRGNRFHILFNNQGGTSNRLLQSMKFDMDTYEFVAACKALVLVSYLTTSLWCLVEEGGIHILDIATCYKENIIYRFLC